MKEAIKAAENARGKCSPNPFVGVVIVRDGLVIATGLTQAYGFDHAEVNALNKVTDTAVDAEMYVTLEPCSHYGKTPPCTQAIIRAGIRTVYIGLIDPNPMVAGSGIKQLQDAGITVQSGFMQDEIELQLEYYLVYIQKCRPFVLWKTALSLDGKFRAEDGSSRWISNTYSRRYVHCLRNECDVVMTGVNTVINDDPLLNVRYCAKALRRDPVRAILDPYLQIPITSRIVQTLSKQRTYIFHADDCPMEKRETLRNFGAELIAVKSQGTALDLNCVMNELYDRKHYLILLECGGLLSDAFWSERLIDKCIFIYGNKIVGGKQALFSGLDLPSISDAITIERIKVHNLHDNILVSGYPKYNHEAHNSS